MRYIKTINELYKSPGYMNRITTPDSEVGDLTWSRFVEWTPRFTQGWELLGMQEVDEDGYELSNRYIAIDKFIFEQGLNENEVNVMKISITAALGQLGNSKWIDGFKFEQNKANALICLGKVGLIFKNKYYTPIFRFMKREGSLFWIVADFYKGNQIARSIVVTRPDISKFELERNSIEIQNAHYRREFEEENKQRRKERRPLLLQPKEVKDERVFINQLTIIKDTGEKQFFVIYIDNSKYDRIQFAKKMTGADVMLDLPRTAILKTAEMKRGYNKQNYFYLTDIHARERIFYYFNKSSEKWEKYILIRPIVQPNSSFKEIEAETVNKVKVRMKIKAGDLLKISKIQDDDENKINLLPVEVLKINPKDNKKIEVKLLKTTQESEREKREEMERERKRLEKEERQREMLADQEREKRKYTKRTPEEREAEKNRIKRSYTKR